MTIQRSKAADAVVLSHPGKQSEQIVWPGSAPDALVTITRVSMEPGAVSALHGHFRSEQIWLVEHGQAELLCGDGQTEPLEPGDVVRTPAGERHRIRNTGGETFIYLTVTCPPEDMSSFYERHDR